MKNEVTYYSKIETNKHYFYKKKIRTCFIYKKLK